MPQSSESVPDIPHVKGVRPALLEAIRQLAANPKMTQKEAARLGGLTEHGLQRALQRPQVRELLECVRRARRDGKTAEAWEVVYDLMDGAASEDVRHKAARTVLAAAGELEAENGKPQVIGQLIHIVTQTVSLGDQPAYERLPGVVERPPEGWSPDHGSGGDKHPMIQIGRAGA
jgi:hypothetical protein